jgi:hypothetical protein
MSDHLSLTIFSHTYIYDQDGRFRRNIYSHRAHRGRQKHRPDVMAVEDGKVVEIVDLLTGKIHDGAREDQATSRT